MRLPVALNAATAGVHTSWFDNPPWKNACATDASDSDQKTGEGGREKENLEPTWQHCRIHLRMLRCAYVYVHGLGRRAPLRRSRPMQTQTRLPSCHACVLLCARLRRAYHQNHVS